MLGRIGYLRLDFPMSAEALSRLSSKNSYSKTSLNIVAGFFQQETKHRRFGDVEALRFTALNRSKQLNAHGAGIAV